MAQRESRLGCGICRDYAWSVLPLCLTSSEWLDENANTITSVVSIMIGVVAFIGL